MTSAGTPFYVTTPIYYVNDRPHIGHCYTTLVADVVARSHRLLGRDVLFLTGTDEHAEKVSKAAAERGLTPIEWADRNAARFREAFALLNFSNDDFLRTTERRHVERASAYIARLMAQGDITLGDYEGWYDPTQEEYLTETAAKENDFKSPVTGRPLERRTEQNYFFDLPKYAEWLEGVIRSDRLRILPEARKNEVLGRLREGLQRVPVSRRIRDGEADWGIRMPGDPQHRVYVWIEALCNYLTAVDNRLGVDTTGADGGERRRFWPASVHLMAKDILWFHAVIWPAMLRALGEKPPEVVYAHAYFVAEGRKMSKSLGNFVEIDTLRAYADRYSRDAVRWYLATQGPIGASDADFSYSRFVEVYNSDLANGIGNCASRTANMIEKYFGGEAPDAGGVFSFDERSAEHPEARWDWPAATASAASEFAHLAGPGFDWAGALRLGVRLSGAVDLFIGVTRPFTLAKEIAGPDDPRRARLGAILYSCAEALRIASLLLYPAMPEKMAQLWREWGCEHLKDPDDARSPLRAPLAELASWGGAYGIRPGQKIRKGEALFMRADAALAPPEAGAEAEGSVG